MIKCLCERVILAPFSHDPFSVVITTNENKPFKIQTQIVALELIPRK